MSYLDATFTISFSTKRQIYCKLYSPGPPYDQVKGKKMRKIILNHSSSSRQTNAHIFCLLRITDTKQRFWNSSCFDDQDATKVFFLLAPSFIRKQVHKKIIELYFVSISAIKFNAFYCKIRLALEFLQIRSQLFLHSSIFLAYYTGSVKPIL